MPIERRWLSIREAAAYLSVHPKTAYDWAGRGIIPTAKINGTLRIDKFALDRSLELQIQTEQRRGKR